MKEIVRARCGNNLMRRVYPVAVDRLGAAASHVDGFEMLRDRWQPGRVVGRKAHPPLKT